MYFTNRSQAGRVLASKLLAYQNRPNVIVLALPRGGLPVGYEVAQALHAPLDVLVVRKVGLPGFREMGVGALAAGGIENISTDVVDQYGFSAEALQEVIDEEREELLRRERDFRGERPFPAVQGKTVILVDDGLATGSTMNAAIDAVNAHGAAEVVVAGPVGAAESCDSLRSRVDQVVCAYIPAHFDAVGAWYFNFNQTTDEEVKALLRKAEQAGHHPSGSG